MIDNVVEIQEISLAEYSKNYFEHTKHGSWAFVRTDDISLRDPARKYSAIKPVININTMYIAHTGANLMCTYKPGFLLPVSPDKEGRYDLTKVGVLVLWMTGLTWFMVKVTVNEKETFYKIMTEQHVAKAPNAMSFSLDYEEIKNDSTPVTT